MGLMRGVRHQSGLIPFAFARRVQRRQGNVIHHHPNLIRTLRAFRLAERRSFDNGQRVLPFLPPTPSKITHYRQTCKSVSFNPLHLNPREINGRRSGEARGFSSESSREKGRRVMVASRGLWERFQGKESGMVFDPLGRLVSGRIRAQACVLV